jgi:carboxylate-amine ligase
MGTALTLGIEEELHIVDLKTRQLAARAPELLARLPSDHFSAELQRTTVETNTPVAATLSELRADVVGLRQRLVSVADDLGLGVAAVGTAPLSTSGDFELTSTGRFARMQEDYRLLVDEQLICGLQVHVGLANRDLAVAVAQRVAKDLPFLLALSASSPFWHGADTGYASIRTIIWQRWPTAGATGPLASAADYDALLDDLIASGVITDRKMAYFDVRPSAHVPTVELRVCDGCPLVDDAVLVAGLFRALVHDAVRAVLEDEPFASLPAPLHRAAMWRAARSGLTGTLLDAGVHPRPVPASEAIEALLRRVRPSLEELGDWETVSGLAEAALTRGNSADRQRQAYAEYGRLTDVVDTVVRETSGESSGSPAAPILLADYPAGPNDEAFLRPGVPRPAYLPLLSVLHRLPAAQLEDRSRARDGWALKAGMTYAVAGEPRPFPVDLVPRVLLAHEWRRLEAGLIQRARALECFLRDVYGDALALRDGVVPAKLVYGSPGWRNEARHLPRGTTRAAVVGFDLVRDEHGGFRVLEDNVRVPSGAGYAVAVREMIDAVLPDLPRPDGLLDARTAPALLGSTLRANRPDLVDARIGLLSDWAGNSAWFEHRLLAEQGGFVLGSPSDVRVTGRSVFLAGEPVDVLYLRLDVELPDLVAAGGEPVGRELMLAAARGAVFLANAPGNGVADDKAMYTYVPDMITYYLGERALLDPVPTYRCGDPDEAAIVLARLEEMVTKPVDGFGGGGVLIGPHASAAELAERRAAIVAAPHGWVAQDTLPLSAHPTFGTLGLEPRHVDLRAFVYLSGTGPDDAQLADAALTRVAPAGSMIVNSSRGGGAKDTWILGHD